MKGYLIKKIGPTFCGSLFISALFLGTNINAQSISIDTIEVKEKTYIAAAGIDDVSVKTLIKAHNNENKINEYQCDTGTLKRAIVKLIEKNVQLEKRVSALETKAPNELTSRFLSNAKSVKKIDGPIYGPKTKKTSCSKVKVFKKYKVSDLNGSFIKFDKEKTFKVASHKVREFKVPLLGSAVHSDTFLKKGSYVKADMFTRAGWVHIKDGGWVKGFLMYPKVLQVKGKRSYKIKEKCD